MTGKSMTEGFDPDYGRMDVRLGSTPNPLTPNVGSGMVVGVARYIDPPTEILTRTTRPLAHHPPRRGLPCHALPPVRRAGGQPGRLDQRHQAALPGGDRLEGHHPDQPDGRHHRVRPKPAAMKLPFRIPDSNRLLDPTTRGECPRPTSCPSLRPLAYAAVAQVTNVMTNFGWEYVWHCHLLGHEENDMMRPMVFQVPVTMPRPDRADCAQPQAGQTHLDGCHAVQLHDRSARHHAGQSSQ